MTQEDRDQTEGRLRRELREGEANKVCLKIKMDQLSFDLKKVIRILDRPEMGCVSDDGFSFDRNFKSPMMSRLRKGGLEGFVLVVSDAYWDVSCCRDFTTTCGAST